MSERTFIYETPLTHRLPQSTPLTNERQVSRYRGSEMGQDVIRGHVPGFQCTDTQETR